MTTIFDTIADFKYGDEIIPFLSAVREAYDEHYGKWYQEDNDGEITVDVRTGGWSENEEVVDAMLGNFAIRHIFYDSWERGGRHVFKFYMPEQ